MLEIDDGARRLGEVAFGLNYEIDRFTQNTLFDEKIGGTMHVALGAASRISAAQTSPASTGTSSATCARTARSTPTASSSGAPVASSSCRPSACLSACGASRRSLVGYSARGADGRPDRPPRLAERRAAARAALRGGAAGGRPSDRPLLAGARRASCSRRAATSSSSGRPRRELEDIEQADVWIVVDAPSNTKALTSVDPEREAPRAAGAAAVAGALPRACPAGELRWVLTAYPTNGAAQDAEMSLAEYERFIYDAAFLDEGDPVARWRAFADELERVAELLSTKEGSASSPTAPTSASAWAATAPGCPPTGTRTSRTARSSRLRSMRAPRARSLSLPRGLQRPAGGRRASALPRRRGGRGLASRGEEFLQEMVALDDGARRGGSWPSA